MSEARALIQDSKVYVSYYVQREVTLCFMTSDLTSTFLEEHQFL